MSWLVEGKLATAGQPKRRHQAEALVADLLRELDPLGAQLLDRRANVVAHQVQLVVGIAVGGMGGQLGGRKGEDRPPAAGIDRGEIEHLATEGSVCFSVAGENDRVAPDDQRVWLPAVGRAIAMRETELSPVTPRRGADDMQRSPEAALATANRAKQVRHAAATALPLILRGSLAAISRNGEVWWRH